MMTSLLKWSLTWILAFVPIIFTCCRQLLGNGVLDVAEISKTGEGFLVSIVMVAEPLSSIITSKLKDQYTLGLSICILLVVLSSTYFYSLVEFGRDNLGICLSNADCSHRVKVITTGTIICSLILGGVSVIHVHLNKADS